MIEFVFMLTHHDRTVPDAADVYEQVRECGLRYVGFKDIGATVTELRKVCARAHADGLEVMLEVVSTSLEEELRSVAAAAEIGVDWLLGGTHPGDGLRVLDGSRWPDGPPGSLPSKIAPPIVNPQAPAPSSVSIWAVLATDPAAITGPLAARTTARVSSAGSAVWCR